MQRALTKLILLLIVAFGINLAVTCTCVLCQFDPTEARAHMSKALLLQVFSGRDIPDYSNIDVSTRSSFGFDIITTSPVIGADGHLHNDMSTVVRAGLPLRCVEADISRLLVQNSADQSTGSLLLVAMNNPIWGGLLGNIAIYAIVCVIALHAFRFKRYLRDRAGLCPHCAFDLRGNVTDGCPECGWNRVG